MPWVKLSDTFAEDPRLDRAGPLALALHVAALCWCSRNLTDGVIPRSTARRLLDLAEPLDVAARLVTVGMWEETPDEYVLVDYLTDQPSAAKVLEQRQLKVNRQAKWLAKKRDAARDASQDESNDDAPPRPAPKEAGRGTARRKGAHAAPGKCQEHTTESARNCSSCHSEVLTGERRPEDVGRVATERTTSP